MGGDIDDDQTRSSLLLAEYPAVADVQAFGYAVQGVIERVSSPGIDGVDVQELLGRLATWTHQIPGMTGDSASAAIQVFVMAHPGMSGVRAAPQPFPTDDAPSPDDCYRGVVELLRRLEAAATHLRTLIPAENEPPQFRVHLADEPAVLDDGRPGRPTFTADEASVRQVLDQYVAVGYARDVQKDVLEPLLKRGEELKAELAWLAGCANWTKLAAHHAALLAALPSAPRLLSDLDRLCYLLRSCAVRLPSDDSYEMSMDVLEVAETLEAFADELSPLAWLHHVSPADGAAATEAADGAIGLQAAVRQYREIQEQLATVVQLKPKHPALVVVRAAAQRCIKQLAVGQPDLAEELTDAELRQPPADVVDRANAAGLPLRLRSPLAALEDFYADPDVVVRLQWEMRRAASQTHAMFLQQRLRRAACAVGELAPMLPETMSLQAGRDYTVAFHPRGVPSGLAHLRTLPLNAPVESPSTVDDWARQLAAHVEEDRDASSLPSVLGAYARAADMVWRTLQGAPAEPPQGRFVADLTFNSAVADGLVDKLFSRRPGPADPGLDPLLEPLQETGGSFLVRHKRALTEWKRVDVDPDTREIATYLFHVGELLRAAGASPRPDGVEPDPDRAGRSRLQRRQLLAEAATDALSFTADVAALLDYIKYQAQAWLDPRVLKLLPHAVNLSIRQ